MIHDQQGQTLIETIVAAFILTTAVVTGLGLAIYSLSLSKTSANQIIATSLAREGIDVVRLYRDSNWLLAEPDPAQADPDITDDLQSCPDLGGRFCYPKVYDGPFKDLNQATYPAFGNGSYRVSFNPSTRVWNMETVANYDLYLQADKTYSHNPNGFSSFARQIKINFLPITDGTCSAPCNNRIISVESIVAWRGKNCAEFVGGDDLETLNTRCKILVEEQLMNWKDYK